MRWMEIAWTQQGIAETSGAAATPAIVDYFRECGHPDIVSDETPWCAVFVGACLERAGIRSTRDTRAVSYAEFGTALPLDQPRVGAIAVLRFADGSHHTGYVTGWTPTTLALLGGNQKDAVTVTHFKRAALLALRWPEPPATAATLAAAGSRTIQAAKGQVRDAWLTVGSLASAAGAKMADPGTPATTAKVLGRANEVMSQAAMLQKFAGFCVSSWPWIAGTIAAWFVVRMLVAAGAIEAARVEDHNTGANTARSSGAAA